ncbi:hypothetical protein D3C80_544790 [compost metagenome]
MLPGAQQLVAVAKPAQQGPPGRLQQRVQAGLTGVGQALQLPLQGQRQIHLMVCLMRRWLVLAIGWPRRAHALLRWHQVPLPVATGCRCILILGHFGTPLQVLPEGFRQVFIRHGWRVIQRRQVTVQHGHASRVAGKARHPQP